MATNRARSKAVTDMFVNGVSTPAQQLELAEAIYFGGLRGPPFAELPSDQRDAIIPKALREAWLPKIRALRDAKAKAQLNIVDPDTDFAEGS